MGRCRVDMRRRVEECVGNEEASGHVTIIAPERPLLDEFYLGSPFDMRPEHIRRVIRYGYKCALRALADHPLLAMALARQKSLAPA